MGLPVILQPGIELMHGNTFIHISGIIKNWFSENGILLVDFPPYSPNLTPY